MGKRGWPAPSLTLKANMKIWCKIQVLINTFLQDDIELKFF